MRREERDGRRGREKTEETGNVREDGRDRDGRGKNWVGRRERHRVRSVERLRGFVSWFLDCILQLRRDEIPGGAPSQAWTLLSPTDDVSLLSPGEDVLIDIDDKEPLIPLQVGWCWVPEETHWFPPRAGHDCSPLPPISPTPPVLPS